MQSTIIQTSCFGVWVVCEYNEFNEMSFKLESSTGKSQLFNHMPSQSEIEDFAYLSIV